MASNVWGFHAGLDWRRLPTSVLHVRDNHNQIEPTHFHYRQHEGSYRVGQPPSSSGIHDAIDKPMPIGFASDTGRNEVGPPV
jgi:hypothetical protein